MKRFVFLLLSLLSIWSCQKKEPFQKTLHLCFNMEPLTLDARKSGELSASTLLSLLFNGLTELQSNGCIKLSLAKSYEISKDKKIYTFHLRDATWSDGKAITAYDFEKSWKKIIDPSFPSLCPQLLYPIKNAECIAKKTMQPDQLGCHAQDEKTFIVELENPTPYFLELVSFCIFYPVPSHINEQMINKSFVSSGPFILEKWAHNSEMILKKNPLYWDKEAIKLDLIHISFVNNENTALQMYEKGEIDFVGTSLSPIPSDSIPSLLANPEFRKTAISGTAFCTFNLEKFPFNNKNIRKAFSLAIDRRAIAKNICQANAICATRCLPPILMKNKNRFIVEDNNSELANLFFKKGLEELNIKAEDLRLKFSCSALLLHKKIAEAMQENWEKTFHIKIDLDQLEEKVIIERFHKHDFQFGLRYWIAQYYDPMNILERFKYKTQSKNYPQWENGKFIQLLDLSYLASGYKEREAILEDAEDLFMEESPISPIYHFNYTTLTKPYVKNIIIGPIGDIHFEKAVMDKKL